LLYIKKKSTHVPLYIYVNKFSMTRLSKVAINIYTVCRCQSSQFHLVGYTVT